MRTIHRVFIKPGRVVILSGDHFGGRSLHDISEFNCLRSPGKDSKHQKERANAALHLNRKWHLLGRVRKRFGRVAPPRRYGGANESLAEEPDGIGIGVVSNRPFKGVCENRYGSGNIEIPLMWVD